MATHKVLRGKPGDFYNQKVEVIYQKDELWKAIRTLLEELTGEKFTMKDIRKAWPMYCKSSFIKSMSFGEFIMGMYWGASVDG